MSKEIKDSVREERIYNEIIVDAYDSEERANGWYYYLEDVMTFPFKAECITADKRSLLKVGEQVEALTILPIDDNSIMEMYVEISWNDRQFGVPLKQLKPIDVDEETKEAIADWQYWKKCGFEF